MSTTYTASCHCKANKVTITDVEPVTSVISCNCSICNDRGSLIAFFPVDKVALPNEENLTSYKFNKKILDWKFCKTCGSTLYATTEGQPKMGVNARCIEGLEMEGVKLVNHDGKSS